MHYWIIVVRNSDVKLSTLLFINSNKFTQKITWKLLFFYLENNLESFFFYLENSVKILFYLLGLC